MGESRWEAVCRLEELDEAEPLAVRVNNVHIAAYRVGDQVYVTSDICTHAKVQLSQGYLEGFTIECPLHQGQFDIRTGACLGGPVIDPLKCYAVKIEGEIVHALMEVEQQA